jgi:pentatricopeptide repeat protein
MLRVRCLGRSEASCPSVKALVTRVTKFNRRALCRETTVAYLSSYGTPLQRTPNKNYTTVAPTFTRVFSTATASDRRRKKNQKLSAGRIFLQSLDEYVKGKEQPQNETLCRRLREAAGDGPKLTFLLIRAIEFENRFPECKGFVTQDEFKFVLTGLVQLKRWKLAERVLYKRGPPQAGVESYAIVMNAYAEQKDEESFIKIKRMLSALERDAMSSPPGDGYALTAAHYNIFMKAVRNGVRRDQIVPSLEKTIQRMQKIHSALNDPMILPDLFSYNTLLASLIREGREGYESKVEVIMGEILAQKRFSAVELTQTVSLAIGAWRNSRLTNAVDSARDLFGIIRSPTTECFNTMLKVYDSHGRTADALSLFDRMQKESKSSDICRPDNYTYATVLGALHKSKGIDALRYGKSIFDTIEKPDLYACNAMLSILAKHGSLIETMQLYQRMKSDYESGANRDCKPNAYSVSNLLLAIEREGSPDQARTMFDLIEMPDTVAYLGMLRNYANHSKVNEALALFEQMLSDFTSMRNPLCPPSQKVYAVLLKCFSRAKGPESCLQAEKVFNSIEKPNTILCSTMLNIYASRGMTDKCIDLVQRMLSDYDSKLNLDCKPDTIAYNTVLKALQKSSLPDAEKAKDVFQKIAAPDTLSYNSLLSIYASLGQADAALELFHEMRQPNDTTTNCQPDDSTYYNILMAYQNSKKSDAIEASRSFFDMVTKPNTSLYNTMLNMYALRGRVDEGVALIENMKEAVKTGQNNRCTPSEVTRHFLIKLFMKANVRDAEKAASLILPDALLQRSK